MKSGERNRNSSGESTSSSEVDPGDYIPTPPDGGWGWVVVASSFMCFVIVDGLGYSFGVLLPLWVDVFQESRGKVSLIGSLLNGMYLCAGILYNLISVCTDRHRSYKKFVRREINIFKVDKNPHFITHNLYIVLLQDLLLVD